MNYSNGSVEDVIHLVPSGREHLDYGVGKKDKNYSDNAVGDEPIHPEGNRENDVWKTKIQSAKPKQNPDLVET